MAQLFDCPYVGAEVELTDERTGHISRKHPEALLELADLIRLTLADPTSCAEMSARRILGSSPAGMMRYKAGSTLLSSW